MNASDDIPRDHDMHPVPKASHASIKHSEGKATNMDTQSKDEQRFTPRETATVAENVRAS